MDIDSRQPIMPMAIFFGNDIFETFLILRVPFAVIRIAERAYSCVYDAGSGVAYGMFYPTIWHGVRYCCHCSSSGAVKLRAVRLFDRTRDSPNHPASN